MSYQENLFYGASALIHQRAKELRNRMTLAEKVLWAELKNKKLEGLKFRSQHPIDQYIVDFYCHKLKLVIELDGEIHNSLDSREYDEGRTFELERLGLKVLRFNNIEVENNLEKVLATITSQIKL